MSRPRGWGSPRKIHGNPRCMWCYTTLLELYTSLSRSLGNSASLNRFCRGLIVWKMRISELCYCPGKSAIWLSVLRSHQSNGWWWWRYSTHSSFCFQRPLAHTSVSRALVTREGYRPCLRRKWLSDCGKIRGCALEEGE